MVRFCFREPHHFTDLDYDLGQRQSMLLLSGHFRLYGEAERIYEREEPFVVLRHEIAGQPGNCNWAVFHERLAEERRRQ